MFAIEELQLKENNSKYKSTEDSVGYDDSIARIQNAIEIQTKLRIQFSYNI